MPCTRRSFVEDFGVAPGKVVAVGAGANLDALPEPPFERAPSPPRVLFVGLKFDRKGGPDLLSAFARLRADHPDAELWLVGPPPGSELPPRQGDVHGGVNHREERARHGFDEVHVAADHHAVLPHHQDVVRRLRILPEANPACENFDVHSPNFTFRSHQNRLWTCSMQV